MPVSTRERRATKRSRFLSADRAPIDPEALLAKQRQSEHVDDIPLDIADRLSMLESAKIVGVSNQSLWRWALRPNRYGVKLRTCVVGGVRFTCRAWLTDYIRESTAAAERGGQTAVGINASRQKRIEAAKRELARR